MVSIKYGANFSNQVQGHLKVIEGHKYMNLTYFMYNVYIVIKIYSPSATWLKYWGNVS